MKQLKMNKIVFILVFVNLILQGKAGSSQEVNTDYTKFVNPFIGTGTIDSLSLSGSTFPGAVVPFGFVQLSPDTDDFPFVPCSGYDYADDTIVGFSHTHLSGTGVADLFDILFMPFRGKAKWNGQGENSYSSSFNHKNETASPGYYSVILDDAKIKAELTTTEHCGMHKYSNLNNKAYSFMIDMEHSINKKDVKWPAKLLDAQIRIIDNRTIEGHRSITGWASERKVYFRAEFSKPFTSTTIRAGNKIYKNEKVLNNKNVKLIASFKGDDEPLIVKVGLSSVSYEGARNNLNSEITDFDFEAVRNKAEKKWNKELSVIDIEGSEEQKTIFYTAMYHTLIHPNNIADVNGDYTNSNGELRTASSKRHYSTFSLWDTYRAEHPLLTITQQERTADFINSMIRQCKDYGYLPIWELWGKETYCMIGNHSIPVIVDAFFKKIPHVDYLSAYEAVKASSLSAHKNFSSKVLDKYSHFPEDVQSQSVSITLEVAFNDWCVAQMAKELGYKKDYEYFSKRAHSYKNLFDPELGFFRAKDSTGVWIEPFNPLIYGANGGNPFTEGNAWQYLWYVPHDVHGLIELFGGKSNFVRKLDEFFTLNAKPEDINHNASGFIGQYAHGNEVSHHIIYLYNYSNEPWKAQYYAAKVLNEQYLTTPAGYSGNEDCGQMSAWYIFSSMGFYPLNPSSGVYCFGSPQLPRATIHLEDGKEFNVVVKNAGGENIYIQKIKLNGKAYTKTYITHNDIVGGGVIEFFMGEKPNKKMANYEKPIPISN